MEIVKLLILWGMLATACGTLAFCVLHWPGTTITHILYQKGGEPPAEKENLNVTGCVELPFQQRCLSYDL